MGASIQTQLTQLSPFSFCIFARCVVAAMGLGITKIVYFNFFYIQSINEQCLLSIYGKWNVLDCATGQMSETYVFDGTRVTSKRFGCHAIGVVLPTVTSPPHFFRRNITYRILLSLFTLPQNNSTLSFGVSQLVAQIIFRLRFQRFPFTRRSSD